jgi:hypothetical protein
MSDNGKKEQGTNDPGDCLDDNGRDGGQGGQRRTLIWPVVQGIVASGFFALSADAFDDFGLQGAKQVFRILGVVCCLSLASQFLASVWPNRRGAVWSAFALLSITILTVGVLYKKPKPEDALPRLVFALVSNPENRVAESRLDLTNDFFLKGRGRLDASTVRGVLLIPIRSNQSSVELSFALINQTEVGCNACRLQIDSDFKEKLKRLPLRRGA